MNFSKAIIAKWSIVWIAQQISYHTKGQLWHNSLMVNFQDRLVDNIRVRREGGLRDYKEEGKDLYKETIGEYCQ